MCSIICKYFTIQKHVLYLCFVKSFPLKYRTICKMHSLRCKRVFSFHMKISFTNVNSLTTKIHVKLNVQAALDETEPLGSEATASPPIKIGWANRNGAQRERTCHLKVSDTTPCTHVVALTSLKTRIMIQYITLRPHGENRTKFSLRVLLPVASWWHCSCYEMWGHF